MLSRVIFFIFLNIFWISCDNQRTRIDYNDGEFQKFDKNLSIEKVKFLDLIEFARKIGASSLVTGHYIKKMKTPTGPRKEF